MASVLEWTKEEWQKLKKQSKVYQNCPICNKRLVLALYTEPPKIAFCPEHCPQHKWQSGYDWPTECGICGVHYPNYLESMLESNKIPFQTRKL